MLVFHLVLCLDYLTFQLFMGRTRLSGENIPACPAIVFFWPSLLFPDLHCKDACAGCSRLFFRSVIMSNCPHLFLTLASRIALILLLSIKGWQNLVLYLFWGLLGKILASLFSAFDFCCHLLEFPITLRDSLLNCISKEYI